MLTRQVPSHPIVTVALRRAVTVVHAGALVLPGVFDRAEPVGCSHFAFAGVAFRTLEQRRHSDFRPLSRLNTLPACSPVNASRAALRLPAHDSGPGWLATPYLYDSCIRDFTPVYPGALQLRPKLWFLYGILGVGSP